MPSTTKLKKLFSKWWFPVVLWRLLLQIVMVFSYHLLPSRQGQDFSFLHYFVPELYLKHWPSIEAWSNFDGVHYLMIAVDGYSNNMRFFPLYPMLITIVSWPWHHWYSWALISSLVISHVALGLGLWCLRKLLIPQVGVATADRTILALIVFPTSFFLVGSYTESLWLALTVAALWLAQQKKIGSTWLTVFALGITRITGLAVLPLLWWQTWKNQQETRSQKIHTTIWYASAGIGLVAFAGYCWWRWHNPIIFITAHTQLQNGRTATSLVFPLQTMIRYLKILGSVSPRIYEWWIAALELGSVLWAAGTSYSLWLDRKLRSYLWLVLPALAVPLVSGTFSGLPRYVAPLFPLHLVLARNLPRRWFYGYLSFCLGLQILLVMAFGRGWFVA